MSTPRKELDLSRLAIREKGELPREGANPLWAFAKVVAIFVLGTAMGWTLFSLREPSGGKSSNATLNPPAPGDGARKEPVAHQPTGSEKSERMAGTLDATGYVVAQRKAAVSSKATGRLLELRVKEGDRVQANDIIGVLENADAKAIVAEHEASLVAARSKTVTAAAELEDARRQQTRMQNLNEPGAISKNDRDTVEARFRKAAAELDAARAAVTVEEARLEKAKVDLEYTLIRAPFSGTVLSKDADIGEVVAPFGSAANARGAVVTVADMDSLQVEADVSEANLSKATVGQHCTITLDSYPEKKYEGEVASIVPTVDRAKGTVTVKIRFLNKDDRVIPEMSAKISFSL